MRILSTVSAVLLLAGTAHAQIAVSANDGKQPRLSQKPSDVRPDNLAVIDLNAYPPRVIGRLEAPVSMIGPPTAVAVAPDASFAIVTASQKLDPKDSTAFILDDKVSVIDLKEPTRPRLAQTLSAGAGATGVAINRAGTLALVASTGEGTISIYTIKSGRLTPAGKLQLDPTPGPVDVAISPDGKTALVTQRRGEAIWKLAIDGARVTDTGVTYPTGVNPYGVVFSPDSRYAYNSNLLGRPQPPRPAGERGGPPRIGTVSVIDLKSDRVVDTIDVGPTPEHVSLSPDGRHLLVTVVNGSSADPGTPNYNDYGLLKIFRADGHRLTQVAEARTGQWGQGAAWSDDGRTILQQGAIDKVIQVFRFDGHSLSLDETATIRLDTRPGSIATARSR